MGWCGVYGFEPLRYLHSQDPIERLAIETAIERAHKHHTDLQKQLAYFLARATWGEKKTDATVT